MADKSEKAVSKAQDEVQKAKDVEEEQGYHGVKVDPTPNEHYTVAGVTAGKPTPETDADAHHDAYMASTGSRFSKPNAAKSGRS